MSYSQRQLLGLLVLDYPDNRDPFWYIHTWLKRRPRIDGWSICLMAHRSGDPVVAEWAVKHGCVWKDNTVVCWKAARDGNLEHLCLARSLGCVWDYMTTAEAARQGDLTMLQWARERGCPWNSWTCANAAEHGHADVLKWARDNGCPWDYREFTGIPEVLEWALKNGCPPAAGAEGGAHTKE